MAARAGASMASRLGASMALMYGCRSTGTPRSRGAFLTEDADALLRAIGVERQIAAEEPVDENEIRLVDNLDHLATTEVI